MVAFSFVEYWVVVAAYTFIHIYTLVSLNTYMWSAVQRSGETGVGSGGVSASSKSH